MEFKDLISKTVSVIQEFEKTEKRKWGIEGSMIELSKQVGDLSKTIMSYENYYIPIRDNVDQYKSSKEKIADELSDLLFIIIRIANHYQVDLEKEHLKQLQMALDSLSEK